MKPNILSICILSVFVTASCAKDPVSPVAQEPKPIEVDAKSKMVIEGSNRFGFELFREIWQQEDAGKNLMISPLSVELALAMTYNGAGGTTKEAFEKVLHVDELPAQDLNTSLHDLTKALLEVDPRVTMEIANSIWYRNTFHVEDVFLETNKNYFDAEIRPLDFDDPRSTGIINGWVDEKTHHKIPEIVDEIDPASVMFLINAIYFKGVWRYRFDKKNTTERPFHPSPGKTVMVPTMMRKGDFLYSANDLFSALELPYGRGNYSMVILLPLPDKKVGDIVEVLTPENWDHWMSAFDTLKDLTIYIPKFSFSYKKRLNDPLITLGLGIAFSGGADFSGISRDYDLYISQVRHKTFIDVNEEGTEAAAVTSVEMRYTSAGSSFLLDRPFLFVIKEKYTGAILFMGKVSEPNVEF